MTASCAILATSVCAPTRAPTTSSERAADARNESRSHTPIGCSSRRRHHQGPDWSDYYSDIAEVDGAAREESSAHAVALSPRRRARRVSYSRISRTRCRTGWVGSKLPRRAAPSCIRRPTNRDALRWLANQNCVIVHSWLSRRDRLHTPDRIIFDLDPSTDDFAVVKATARTVADVLDDLGLVSYLQTTGSRGLHVVTPIKGDADYDTARQFAKSVAEVVADDDPAHRTVEMRKAKRGDRVYLDVMRNAYAQTAVAPYSLRARRDAPVATPLDWDELGRRGLRSDFFTIRDVPKRVAERGDPWSDIARRGRSLTRPTQRLAKTSCLNCPTSRGSAGNSKRHCRDVESATSTCLTPASSATQALRTMRRQLGRTQVRQAAQARQMADPSDRRPHPPRTQRDDGPSLLRGAATPKTRARNDSSSRSTGANSGTPTSGSFAEYGWHRTTTKSRV